MKANLSTFLLITGFLFHGFLFSQKNEKLISTADSCYASANYSLAVKLYSQCLKTDPNNCDLLNSRAGSYFSLMKYSQAIPDYNKIIDKKCRLDLKVSVYKNRGYCFITEKKFEDARKDFTKYLIFFEDSYTLAQRAYSSFALSDFTEAIKDYTRIIYLKDSNYIETAYYGRSLSFFEIDSLENALSDIQQAIRLKPNSLDNYLHRFQINISIEDLVAADKDVEIIKLIDSTDYIYSGCKGALLYNKGDYAQALPYLTEKIERSSESNNSRDMRAYCYGYVKQYHKAIKDLDVLIRIKPKDSDLYNRRGWAYLFIKNYRMALVDLNKSISFDKTNVDAYDSRGCAKYFLGDYSGAIADFNFAILKNKEYANSYFYRAKCFVALKQYRRACTDLGIAAELKDYTVFDGEKTLESLTVDYCRK